jgi:hypothetical protein
MKGVSVSIYRSDLGDCTNRGITSPARSQDKIFVVFDEAVEQGNWDLVACKDNPKFVCLKIVRRNIGGGLYLHIEPMFDRGSGVGPMAGGNFVFTSDSRFRRVSQYPLPVHDRWETQEQFDILSR